MKFYKIMTNSPLRSVLLPLPHKAQQMLDLNAHVIKGLKLPVLVELDHEDCLEGLRFRAGDILVIDRDAKPKAGNVVVCDRNGTHTIELFEPKNAVNRRGLFAVNNDHATVVGVVRHAIVSVCSVRATGGHK